MHQFKFQRLLLSRPRPLLQPRPLLSLPRLLLQRPLQPLLQIKLNLYQPINRQILRLFN